MAMPGAAGGADALRRSGRRAAWPGGLVGRVMLVLLAAVLLEFAGSTVFYEEAQTYSGDEIRVVRTAGTLAAVLRLLEATAPSARADIAGHLSGDDLRLDWAPGAGPMPEEPPGLHALHRAFAARLGPGERLALGRVVHGGVSGSIETVDGAGRLRFLAQALLSRHTVTRGLLSASILAGCVLLAAVMLVRTLSRPLRALAAAADAIGRGPPVRILESGPGEVRRLSIAMLAMQERIGRLISDRTEALAAVSHDLRTPLGRLRLRAGFIEDGELQRAIEEDLAEMEAMLGSVLSFLAGEADAEPRRIVDIAAMLATLVDDASDLGRDARYHGPDHMPARIRPLAMKRVFANLVSNAIVHAGNVAVSLSREGADLRILVEDDGPGIPEHELERVTAPFHRVERSRNRATGGLGLGLAIVSREVSREQGSVSLRNRLPHGLAVEVRLPFMSEQ